MSQKVGCVSFCSLYRKQRLCVPMVAMIATTATSAPTKAPSAPFSNCCHQTSDNPRTIEAFEETLDHVHTKLRALLILPSTRVMLLFQVKPAASRRGTCAIICSRTVARGGCRIAFLGASYKTFIQNLLSVVSRCYEVVSAIRLKHIFIIRPTCWRRIFHDRDAQLPGSFSSVVHRIYH